MTKVSVVIPIYNVSKYIERCMRSLFQQTLNDIEYICVNDCSTDNSIDILVAVLQDYPARKGQVKIINLPENQGQAGARTIGIKAATGIYVIHCDPDDWVDVDIYEKLYTEAIKSKADITICDFIFEFGDKSIYVDNSFIDNDPNKAIKNVYKKDFHCSLCNKLIRREIIERHDIYPYADINVLEDFGCIIRSFYYAHKIAYVPNTYYHYRRTNDTSICNNLKPHHVEGIIDVTNKIVKLLSANKDYRLTCIYYKFNAKAYFLYPKIQNYKQWRNTFSDANKYILFMGIPFRCKVKLLLILFHMQWVVDFLKHKS